MIRTADAESVRWIRFERTERLNAFTVEGYRDLRVAIEAAAVDSEVRVVVLTGVGRAFSVGADLSLLDGTSEETDGDLDAGDEFERLLLALASFSKPLIAAVNGIAVGFGCTLLLHCDLVVAGRSARLRLPFTRMGIVPEAGSSVLVRSRVRDDDAMWAMLSSEWIEADEARRIGMVWRVVDDDALAGEAAAVAGTLAERDPAAVAETKALLTEGRADLVLRAHRREIAAMGRLLTRSAPREPRTPPA